MGLKVTNNAFGTLNASINSSATTIVLVAGQGARFPTLSAGDYFYATLIDTSNNLEIVKCTARSTDTLTVVRGQDSTTARAYATNDRFELRPTAILFNEKANANEYLPLAGGTLTGKLAVGTGTTAAAALHAQSSGSEADRTLRLAYDGTYYANIAQLGAGGLAYRTFGGTAHVWEQGGVEVMRIDGSGRVTNTAQPAFWASVDGGPSATLTGYQYVHTNRGSHFNASTGLFTAPVAGMYMFCGAIMAGYAYTYWRFQKNGSVVGDLHHSGAGGSYAHSSGTGVILLAANDTVSIGGLPSASYSSGPNPWSSFAGYLLG